MTEVYLCTIEDPQRGKERTKKTGGASAVAGGPWPPREFQGYE
ncbi:unnamed protein product [Linum tenue]|uniref:Uncharacterized protein n=1 Tax=Linum tenue TaxID=586396 RepID=A0AAV0P212_9ROSI|nr:unnamed protein product [Linum tenue]